MPDGTAHVTVPSMTSAPFDEFLRAGLSSAEHRMASALEETLKPLWAVYRNVSWLEKRPGDEPADGEADLIVAHRDRGVLAIEVKGGRVQRIGGRWESVDRNGVAHEIKNPFRGRSGPRG